MTEKINLRGQPEAEYWERLFDAFKGAGPNDVYEIVADDDVDSLLLRYQIEHNRALDWEYADPDVEPRELRVTVGEVLSNDTLPKIDVRDLKPQRRHRALLEIFDELNAGEGFVLVNDHDPKPLYYELRSTHGDVVDWAYADRGEGEWRVEVVKTDDSEAPDEDIVTRYDVREIPKEERHPTIHHRYGMIPEGGTMEIVAPHEPRPLHQEFRQQYGDSFTWEVVESEPGRCRVRITKEADDREESVDPSDAEDGVTTSPAGDEGIEITEELDVRDLPPAQRHERIFDAYDELEGGMGFVLVNDHDPKPLYHQFEAETGPAFRWKYQQKEPGEFRVLIGKAKPTDDETIGEEPEVPF